MLSRAMYAEEEISQETFRSVFAGVDHEEAIARSVAERAAHGDTELPPEDILASNDYLDRVDALNIKSEDFDSEAFISAMEMALDYGDPITEEQYALYKQLTDEQANDETAETAADEFDMEM